MKKTITLMILLTNLIVSAQCPAPSNLVYSGISLNEGILSWTENGTATTWDIAVEPDFHVGDPLPDSGWIPTPTNPTTLTGIFPSSGCYVFFVRSVCSSTDSSTWVGVASSGCSIDIYNYVNTLSNDDFPLNTNKSNIQLFPNPTKNNVQIKSNLKINRITVFDSLGKVILLQTQNNNEINVENLSKGIYFLEIFTENGKIYKKIIKE